MGILSFYSMGTFEGWPRDDIYVGLPDLGRYGRQQSWWQRHRARWHRDCTAHGGQDGKPVGREASEAPKAKVDLGKNGTVLCQYGKMAAQGLGSCCEPYTLRQPPSPHRVERRKGGCGRSGGRSLAWPATHEASTPSWPKYRHDAPSRRR